MKKFYFLLALAFLFSASLTQAQTCVASFNATAPSSGLTINYLNTSVTPALGVPSYSWTFGDGASSTLKDPTHTYAQAGTYTVCLFISSMNCIDSTCSTVTITSATPCSASYTYSADTTNTVTFTNLSTPSTGFNYSWDFGDGSAPSTSTNPVHTYASPGAYGVTITATSSSPGTVTTCSFYDTVYVNYCNAYFTSQVGSNGVVSFSNFSAAGRFGVAYDWNFGDGSPLVASKNPTHTYQSSGTYTVTLNLFDSLNNCSSTYSDTVNVQIGTPSSCNASFTIAKDSSVAYGVILYNNSSNFGSHYYSWDFGDGTTGSGRTPIHQYLSFGSYNVCLTITDTTLNCSSTFCDTVGMDTSGNLKAAFGIRVVNKTTVGIEEVDQLDALNIFPNPASNSISLDLRDAIGSVNISIMDLSGRTVVENNNRLTGNIEKFDITGLNNGIYFMVIDDGSNRQIKKFIKSE